MMNKISAIITVRLSDSLFEAHERLVSLIEAIPKDIFDVVLIDYGTPPDLAHRLDEAAQPGVRLFRHPSPRKIYSIGSARDYGVQVSNMPVIMFLDIDFHAPDATFRSIHALAIEKKLDQLTPTFFCIPVLFLTAEGTRLYRTSSSTNNRFPVDISDISTESGEVNVAFPSYGSSAIVCNRHHYMAIGGHNDRFKGHGAEDFELLHRLSSLAPWGPRPPDYYHDTRIKTLEPLSGFRPYFARYALPAIEQGLFLVHRFHPPRPDPGYLRKRRNFYLLKKLMRIYDSRNEMPLPLADLNKTGTLLVIACHDSPEFARARPIISQFGASVFIDERDPALFEKITASAQLPNVDAALLGEPYGSALRTRLQAHLDRLKLRTLIY